MTISREGSLGEGGGADSRSHAARALPAIASAESLDERFAKLEQNDQIEALLPELKEQQPRLA